MGLLYYEKLFIMSYFRRKYRILGNFKLKCKDGGFYMYDDYGYGKGD